jgi:type VI protein secretion system component VasK
MLSTILLPHEVILIWLLRRSLTMLALLALLSVGVLVMSSAVIVSVWAVAFTIRDQLGWLGLPVNWWSMAGVCGVGLACWWLRARSARNDEAVLLHHNNTG